MQLGLTFFFGLSKNSVGCHCIPRSLDYYWAKTRRHTRKKPIHQHNLHGRSQYHNRYLADSRLWPRPSLTPDAARREVGKTCRNCIPGASNWKLKIDTHEPVSPPTAKERSFCQRTCAESASRRTYRKRTSSIRDRPFPLRLQYQTSHKALCVLFALSLCNLRYSRC